MKRRTRSQRLLLGVLGAVLAACGGRGQPYVARARDTMGAVVSIAAWGPDSLRLARAVDVAFDSAARVETLLSLVSDSSEIARLNRSAGLGPEPVSPLLADIVLKALEVARASGGAFDPARRGFRGVVVDSTRHTVSLRPRQRLDLGAFGRGYVLDRASLALGGAADSAVLSSGGLFLILKAQRVVGIVDPDNTLRSVARLTMPPGVWSIGTMSVAEAGDEVIDPRTGKPAARARVVAAVAPSAATAGAWSWGYFVLGCDSALALAPRVGVSVLCADRRLRWSPDLEGRVVPTDSTGSAGSTREP
jgi:thiamine biosynthesis lipoprotein